MTHRQAEIVQAIVQEFVSTGIPVGSQIVVEKYDLSFSSATVRKEMSILEQMGFLTSPHTSAGRIPTDIAFEYYVADLLQLFQITLSERSKLEQFYKQAQMQLEKMLQATASLLAMTSNYAGIVLAPVSKNSIIQRIELVSILDNLIMVIMVSGSGSVFQKKLRIEKAVTQEDLYKVSKFLNQNLKGYEVSDIQEKGLESLVDSDSDLGELADLSIFVAQSLIYNPPDQQVYIEGENHLFNSIERQFESHEIANKLIRKLEDRTFVSNLINDIKKGNSVSCQIGIDIDGERIPGVSVLAKDYFLGGRSIGALGVIGINRMCYDKIIPTLDYSSQLLSNVLSDLNELKSSSPKYLTDAQDDDFAVVRIDINDLEIQE